MLNPRHPPDWSGDPPPAPFDEAGAGADARAVAEALPLSTRFRLGTAISTIQSEFLKKNGFLLFDRVADISEVSLVLAEVDRVEAELKASGRERVNGVPVWFSPDPDGNDYMVRMGFSSQYSPALSEFVRDARFEPVRRLIGEDARIGEREKDGVVFNRYVNAPGSIRPNLAWHTDALRDVFYNWKMPGPMLNVGLHFDRIRPTEGGLRLLPGTHTQGVFSTLFAKIHFVTQRSDPRELAVETWPGDLSVHDGRMWHRVESSPKQGWSSLRRSMYVPYVIDTELQKHENSPTPMYLRLFDRIIRWRASRARKKLGG